jgi:hypothetical protein
MTDMPACIVMFTHVLLPVIIAGITALDQPLGAESHTPEEKLPQSGRQNSPSDYQKIVFYL